MQRGIRAETDPALHTAAVCPFPRTRRISRHRLLKKERFHVQEYLMIGVVLKPKGIRGEIKIKPYAADISLFEKPSSNTS